MEINDYSAIVEKCDQEIGVPSNFKESVMFVMVRKAIEAISEEEFRAMCGKVKGAYMKKGTGGVS